MRRRIIFTLVTLSSLLFSQAEAVNEAIGQTQPFTLAAGEKAGWDMWAAGEQVKVNKLVAPSMTIAPNPAYAGTVIRLSIRLEKASIELIDIAGKRIQHFDVSCKPTLSIGSDLPNGVYFAELKAGGRFIQSTRFIIVR